jgi:hypothetical protein
MEGKKHLCWTCKKAGLNTCPRINKSLVAFIKIIRHNIPSEKYEGEMVTKCSEYKYEGECTYCICNTERQTECLYGKCEHYLKDKEGYCAQTNWERITKSRAEMRKYNGQLSDTAL